MANHVNQPDEAPQPQMPPAKSKGISIMAIVGLILGIMALVSSWIPILNNASFVLAVVALICGIIGLVGTIRGKKAGKGLAVAAVIVAIASCAIVLVTQDIYSDALDSDALDDTTIEESTEESESSSDESDEASDYTISDVTVDIDEDWDEVIIAGTFTNNTDEDMSSVDITYSLYDSDGAQIETAYDYTSDLQAGKSWKFEATAFLDDVSEYDSYELTSVDAW